MSEASTVVHEFEIKRGTIRASISDFRGKPLLDLRLWVEPNLGQDLIPTRKGISVSAEYVDDLVEAVEALAVAVRSGSKAA